MTRLEGRELIERLGDNFARKLYQNLAKNECHVCKRLYGEHSQEEFNDHALIGAGIELDPGPVGPPTPHVFLHFRGHKCADCIQCDECSKLLIEEHQPMDTCLECHRLFRQHNPQEIEACIGRMKAKREKGGRG